MPAVLIVEDSENSAAMLEIAFLGIPGVSVLMAPSATEALRLLEALAKLDVRQREALILQQYHGWKLAQIAEHLGCTSGAVAGLHARGLKRLRQFLTGTDELV